MGIKERVKGEKIGPGNMDLLLLCPSQFPLGGFQKVTPVLSTQIEATEFLLISPRKAITWNPEGRGMPR